MLSKKFSNMDKFMDKFIANLIFVENWIVGIFYKKSS